VPASKLACMKVIMLDGLHVFKDNLTVHRPIMTVDRLKLTFRIEGFQTLTPLPFLILKSLFQFTPPPRNAIERRRWRVYGSLNSAQKSPLPCG